MAGCKHDADNGAGFERYGGGKRWSGWYVCLLIVTFYHQHKLHRRLDSIWLKPSLYVLCELFTRLLSKQY